jgi:hypothetical protein
VTAKGSTPPPAPEREPQRARADGSVDRPQPGASSEPDRGVEGAAPGTDVDGPTAIARRDLETVIRRAVDLSLAERDEEERLSEDEVVRVATELGLPARLARQALYERPALATTPSRFDRWFGDAILSSTRAVPLDADRHMPEIRRVGVLGCGLMGSGIAEIAAKAGYETWVREINDELAARGRANIEKSLDRAVDKGKLEAPARDEMLGRIHMTTSLEELKDATSSSRPSRRTSS